jgi:hypothetical protein
MTWSEARVTPQSFDSKLAPFAAGLFLGDYTGLAARGTCSSAPIPSPARPTPASVNVSVLDGLTHLARVDDSRQSPTPLTR